MPNIGYWVLRVRYCNIGLGVGYYWVFWLFLLGIPFIDSLIQYIGIVFYYLLFVLLFIISQLLSAILLYTIIYHLYYYLFTQTSSSTPPLQKWPI